MHPGAQIFFWSPSMQSGRLVRSDLSIYGFVSRSSHDPGSSLRVLA